MPVYIDDMRAPFGRMIMCHMIADTTEELGFGAIEITWRQCGAMEKRRIIEGTLGDPSKAEEWLQEYADRRSRERAAAQARAANAEDFD